MQTLVEMFEAGNKKDIISLTLCPGIGENIEEKDGIESTIDAWKLNNLNLENPLKRNVLKFRVGNYKTSKVESK